MRSLLCLLVLLPACRSTASQAPENAEPTSPVTSLPTVHPAVADAMTPPPPAPPVEPLQTVSAPPSWNLLITAADELKQQWETLPESKRLSYYHKWVARIDALHSRLIQDADGEELGKIVRSGTLPSSMRTVSAEGYYYSMFVSESWLLKEFGDFPKEETDYLRWILNMDREAWFAEGNLEVKVPVMTTAYNAGLKLLKESPAGFRASYVKSVLGNIFRDIVSLLHQAPAPKQKRRFSREVKAAFQAVAKGSVHRIEAETFLKKMPPSKIPYDFDQVESLRQEVGLP